MKTIQATVKKMGKGWHHYIPLSQTLTNTLKTNGNKRVLLIFNANYHIHVALQSRKEFGNYVMLSNKHIKALNLNIGDRIRFQIGVDPTKYQFEYPETFAEVMRTDPEAFQVFESLTKGNQRGILAIVSSLRNPDKQIEKSLIIADKLKHGITNARAIYAKD